MLTVKAMEMAAAAVLPALAVSYLGIRLKDKVEESVFRRVVLVVIIGVRIISMMGYIIGAFS